MGALRRWRHFLWLFALVASFAAAFNLDDVPALPLLRARYVGVSVRLALAGRNVTATLRASASAAQLTREACAGRPGCDSVANARLVRAACATAAQAADASGLGRLAWELDETRAEVDAKPDTGGAADAATVGIMLLQHTTDAALPLLARSLREAFPPDAERGTARLAAPRLHVLCGPEAATRGYDAEFWLGHFEGRRSLLGGVHIFTNANPFVAPPVQQNDYMAKACAMVRIAALQGYHHIVSSDDDLFVPAHAWRAFAWAAADAGGAAHGAPEAWLARAGCTIATPLVHNAVPTGRLFAEGALGPAAVRELDGCFAQSKLGRLGRIHMDRIPMPMSPWNETEWWSRVSGLPGWFKGGHPIRWDKKCMTLSLDLALRDIPSWWDRGLDSAFAPASGAAGAPAGGLTVHGPGVAPYPYFTAALWMSTARHYAAILDRVDLFVFKYDEVPLNRYTIDERHGALCTLNAFAVHPAYHYADDKAADLRATAAKIDAHVARRGARNP
ncbi:hypothetical protein M885DRAFT_517161 [Pelagophyceae sp. CCMP2097]|nr:hypothetical protein M885DRAFT_517161 [Pelagophyceae sp. CCMP2097]